MIAEVCCVTEALCGRGWKVLRSHNPQLCSTGPQPDKKFGCCYRKLDAPLAIDFCWKLRFFTFCSTGCWVGWAAPPRSPLWTRAGRRSAGARCWRTGGPGETCPCCLRHCQGCEESLAGMQSPPSGHCRIGRWCCSGLVEAHVSPGTPWAPIPQRSASIQNRRLVGERLEDVTHTSHAADIINTHAPQWRTWELFTFTGKCKVV